MKNQEKAQISLQVIVDKEVRFESNGKWLYPLFDLEDFLKDHPLPMARALVRDKVIGKAAALLLIRLGAERVHGELMSELAVETLSHSNISFSYDDKVPRIACQTETLLAEIDDPQQAFEILCQRAGRC